MLDGTPIRTWQGTMRRANNAGETVFYYLNENTASALPETVFSNNKRLRFED